MRSIVRTVRIDGKVMAPIPGFFSARFGIYQRIEIRYVLISTIISAHLNIGNTYAVTCGARNAECSIEVVTCRRRIYRQYRSAKVGNKIDNLSNCGCTVDITCTYLNCMRALR